MSVSVAGVNQLYSYATAACCTNGVLCRGREGKSREKDRESKSSRAFSCAWPLLTRLLAGTEMQSLFSSKEKGLKRRK